MVPSWSDELNFVAFCARTEFDEAAADQIRTFSKSVDWKKVTRLARFHRVQPLIHQATRESCSEHVPPNVASHWHREYLGAAARNLRLAHELHEINDLLRDRGVRAIFFKGPVLAQQAYRNLGLRGSGDIDLYLQPSDFPALEEGLRERGYHPVKAVDSDGEVDQSALRMAGQCPFVHHEHAWSLDVHTALMPPGYSYSIDFDTLYGRSIRVGIAGSEALGFCAEDLLQILCMHGAKNRWEALKHICDVAELLRSHPDLNWDAVTSSAREISGERILFVGLRLAHDILDAPLHEDVRNVVLSDAPAAEIADSIKEYLGYSHERMIAGTERLRFHFKVQDSLRTRARYGIYVLMRRLKDVVK